jgi:NAD(P)-dependent dehydrogenase (short-subunit alcohol dehydrogenase family)
MSENFSGKVVLITGGTSGIGRAAAMAFAEKDATVIICGRNRKAGQSVASEINRDSGNTEFIQADVSDSAQMAAMFNKLYKQYKRLDCAFNAAGGEAALAPVAMQSEAHFDEMLKVDLKGTWLCMHHEIQMMLAQNSGAVVNCSALAGLRGSQGSAIYSACKHGIIGLTKSAALECVASNVRINAICPGIIETPGMEKVFSKVPGLKLEEVKQWGINQVPMHRFGTPEEVAEAVTWLCSNAASYITGHSLIIDGGIHCK